MTGILLDAGGRSESKPPHWHSESDPASERERKMGWDACSSSSSSSSTSASAPAAAAASPCGKRNRDTDDEVYLDNFHSQKRYLSEIMASSLNGLTVGDSLENLMESPSRSETIYTSRDEISSQYSPMSEDSDDARFCDTPINTASGQSDFVSNPTSPVSPYRHQRQVNGFSSVNPYPLPGCTLPAVVCSHARHRGTDSEGRFPSSPNDVCHTADLRRAALLRSVQMRAQPYCPPAYESPFLSEQENMHHVAEEDQSCLCIKTLDDETGYQSSEQVVDYGDVCSSVDISEGKLGQDN